MQNLQNKNHSLHFKSERDFEFLVMHGHDFSIIPSWKNVILSRRAPPKQVILQIQNDIVNIGWHIYLKDITDYAARSKDW